jgi:hypothetical protein
MPSGEPAAPLPARRPDSIDNVSFHEVPPVQARRPDAPADSSIDQIAISFRLNLQTLVFFMSRWQGVVIGEEFRI